MKKITRALAIFMSAVLLICAVPFTSLAAEKLKTVDLTIDIEAGKDSTDIDSFFHINSQGVELYGGYDKKMFIYDGDGEEFSDKFETCVNYCFDIHLIVTDGYSFSGDDFEGVLVNGEYAYCDYWYDETIDANIIYVSHCVFVPGPISDIDLTVNPYGDFYVDGYYRYISINTNSLYYYNGKFAPVTAIDEAGKKVDAFESGKAYTLELYLEPDDLCYFEKDEEGNFVVNSVTVNGEPAEYSIGTYNVNGYSEYIKVVAKVTAKTPKYVNNLSIDLDDDIDGVSVDDWKEYLTINTEGIDSDSVYTWAYEWAFEDYVDVFEKGRYYTLEMSLDLEEGYFFSHVDDSSFITINGEEIYDYYIDGYYNDDGNYVEYISINATVDLVGDGFFNQLMYFIRSTIEMLRTLIKELFANFSIDLF